MPPTQGGVSLLKASAVRPSTPAHYKEMAHGFTRWARRERVRLGSVEQLDQALAQYFDHLFMDGEPSALASQSLASIGHLQPRVGRYGDLKLPRARRAAQGWRRAAPGHSRYPLTWQALMAVIGWALF